MSGPTDQGFRELVDAQGGVIDALLGAYGVIRDTVDDLEARLAALDAVVDAQSEMLHALSGMDVGILERVEALEASQDASPPITQVRDNTRPLTSHPLLDDFNGARQRLRRE